MTDPQTQVKHLNRDPSPLRRLARQILTFGVVGLAGTSVHYITLGVLVEVIGLRPVPATVIGFIFGALTNYVLNYRFTFRSDAAHGMVLPRYLAIAGSSFFINAGIMAAGTDHWPRLYFLVQLFSTGLLFMWNFALSRYWAFKETGNDPT